ncbi:DNA invertase Pin-like site-specific DNA recombinase [Bradyrhizobium sp. JR1.5]|uniref:recombinase family protein n=1 Tax=unclassified Bradyrhizobium TaxID=2631580 RepID=UPI0033979BC1
MSKISAEHLCRNAIVYIRQSTSYQVANNQESQPRQYALADRARQLGWSDVQIVDDDLGQSGAGTVRSGFEKLLAAICEGRVGAVVFRWRRRGSRAMAATGILCLSSAG